MPGHIISQCHRPILDVCSRNEDIVLVEMERAATVRSVEQSVFDANVKPKQQQKDDRKINNGQQRSNSRSYVRNDTNSSHSGGQSRYGSIDTSRYNYVNNKESKPTNERGRQLYHPQQQQQQQQQSVQPQFRPFKSVPPPTTRQHNNNHHQQQQYQQAPYDQQHKRNRNGQNNQDMSSPQHKRQRYS
jgi:hypothetical protein